MCHYRSNREVDRYMDANGLLIVAWVARAAADLVIGIV